jgi:hypothetical protein
MASRESTGAFETTLLEQEAGDGSFRAKGGNNSPGSAYRDMVLRAASKAR